MHEKLNLTCFCIRNIDTYQSTPVVKVDCVLDTAVVKKVKVKSFWLSSGQRSCFKSYECCKTMLGFWKNIVQCKYSTFFYTSMFGPF